MLRRFLFPRRAPSWPRTQTRPLRDPATAIRVGYFPRL